MTGGKYAPILLADFLALTQRAALAPALRSTLLQGVFAAMDQLSQYDAQFLLTTLPESGREIMRALHAEYEREWKFKGKV